MRLLAAFVFVALTALGAAHAQDAHPTYAQMLERLKGGDTDIDYQAFRYAYSETAAYSPYGGTGDKRDMFAALDKGDYDEAVKDANAILAKNYADMDAHLVSFIAYDKKHVSADAQFHRAVLRGLLDSIRDSGDGMTVDTAYVVIAVPEEYSFLGANGYRLKMQALVTGKSGPVDAMTVTDPMGHEMTLYFNVSRSFAAMEKLFGGGPKSPP